MPEDATAALDQRYHVNEIEILKDDDAKIKTTAEIVREIERLT